MSLAVGRANAAFKDVERAAEIRILYSNLHTDSFDERCSLLFTALSRRMQAVTYPSP